LKGFEIFLNIERIIYELEMDFMRADFCRDINRLSGRISDDFMEFGRSGGRSDKHTVVDYLSQITADRKIALSDFHIMQISDHSYLATYCAKWENNGRISNHSSIWINENGKWMILFHQGTIIPET